MKTSPLLVLIIQLIGSRAFAPGFFGNHRGHSKLFAEGGAPQYDKIEAVLKQAEVLSKGSVMLHIDTDTAIDYQPGNVLALEIEGNLNLSELEENEDAKTNGGFLRGPYTVSRATEKSLDILIKVVGDKSKMFANAEAGTPVKFGGKFKVPIVEGIQKEETKRVVLISTGVGVGPCVGAVEEALKDDSFPPVELCASYRNADEIVYGTYLDELQAENPGRFSWKAVVSSESGRLSANEKNLQAIVSPEELGLNDTHYHLIGNGQMVSEFKAGLDKAGIPEDKVTVEMYFNHKAAADDDVIDRIANVIFSAKTAEAL
jgi:ferredoxin-NADP reductase